MVRYQLFAPTGGLVVEIDVPRLSVPPDVIVWGQRSFVLRAGRYVEGFAYAVPPTIGTALRA